MIILKRDRGFTFVEIMVAMIILSLLAVGVFSVILSSRQFIARSKRRLLATQIAQQEIEKKRPYVDADRWSCTTSLTYNPLNASGTWTTADISTYPGYSVRYRVDPSTDGGAYRKVTTQVKWNDSNI